MFDGGEGEDGGEVALDLVDQSGDVGVPDADLVVEAGRK